jgi:perosamine synthetase
MFKYVKEIKKIFKKNDIIISEPRISESNIRILNRYIRKKHVSTYGRATKDFEKKISKYTGSKYVISTINGTAALHVALQAAGVKENDEVLIPSFSFISPANAIRYCNAIPHFIDSELENLGVDPIKLTNYLKTNFYIKNAITYNKKTHRAVKALIVVHAYGHPAKINDLIKICKKYKIKIIEDAAEALGSFYKKKHVGTFGNIGVLSFNGNKIITTGGGGALLTNSKKTYELMLSQVTLSRKKRDLNNYKKVGYNYRMPSINAALGIGQLNNLKKFIKERIFLFKIYARTFKNSQIKIFQQPKNCRSNYWLQLLFLDKNNLNKRKKIIIFYKKNRIELKPSWKLISSISHFSNFPKSNLSQAEYLSKSIINLPSMI